MRAVVLVMDGLSPAFLGPYGRGWVDTPHCDQLAAASVVWDHAVTSSLDLADVYRSYWHGSADDPRPPTPALAELVGQAGTGSTLITDEPEVAEHPAAAAFDRRLTIPLGRSTVPARDSSQTHLAALFGASTQALAEIDDPRLVWIHARGMRGPWDAPYAWRADLADEEDPPPPDFVEPPDESLGDDVDPDRLLGLAQAYAAQISVVDDCLGAWLAALAAMPRRDEWMLVVTAPRGYALGRHGNVGLAPRQLAEDLVQIPLIIQWPAEQVPAMRCQQLAQPADLYGTLLDFFGVSPPDGTVGSWQRLATDITWQPHSQVLIRGGDQRAIRTPSWYLVRGAEGSRLYAKPDDRFEVNEVSNRCAAEVEQLQALLD